MENKNKNPDTGQTQGPSKTTEGYQSGIHMPSNRYAGEVIIYVLNDVDCNLSGFGTELASSPKVNLIGQLRHQGFLSCKANI